MSTSVSIYVGPCIVCDRPRGAASLGDIAASLGDAMFAADLNRTGRVWLPNEHRDAPRNFHGGDPQRGEEMSVSLASVVQTDEMAWLETAFAPELAILREHYRNVFIDWRALAWVS